MFVKHAVIGVFITDYGLVSVRLVKVVARDDFHA